MKIYYATDIDAGDIHQWSGLGWYYRKMLEHTGHDVCTIDEKDLSRPVLAKLRRQLSKALGQRLYSPRFSLAMARKYAATINQRVSKDSVVLSPNTVILSHLRGDFKKVLFADATFDSLLHLYPRYKQLSARCLAEGDEIDRLAVANADLLIYTSHWAAHSSIEHYGADPKKIAVVPFGPNLDNLPDFHAVEAAWRERSNQSQINLLFLGIEWERKGGDLAVAVTEALNNAGVPAKLHLLGIRELPAYVSQNHIVNHGYISKASPEGQQKIGALLLQSHFLLLPSRADCTPVVCSEANAFGVPCLTSDVGGLKSVIEENVNGRTFPIEAFVPESASFIQNLLATPRQYEQLCASSFNKHTIELNWHSVGSKIIGLITAI